MKVEKRIHNIMPTTFITYALSANFRLSYQERSVAMIPLPALTGP